MQQLSSKMRRTGCDDAAIRQEILLFCRAPVNLPRFITLNWLQLLPVSFAI